MKHLHLRLLLSCSLLFSAGIVFSQCPAGLTAYWRLQETTGNTYTDETGNHDAIAGNTPSQTIGISGQSQLFLGSSYLAVPSHADFNWSANTSFSIELWVKYSTTDAVTQVFIGRDDPSTQTHWWIGKTTTGAIQWYTKASDGSNGSVTSAAPYNDNQWHHVVAVRDGSTAKQYLYVDGLLLNTGGTTVTLTASLTSTANITLGNMIYNNNPQYFYTGAIDEAAIYSSALTPAEVTTHNTNIRNFQIGYCSGNAVELLSTPVKHAVVSQNYTYDVDASGNPLPTYSLVQAPTGMTINATTGVISWTPASISQNAPVVVRISNSGGSVDQNFNIFLADAPECRGNLIAYWNFDNAGIPYIDNIAGFNLTGAGPAQTSGRIGSGLAFDGVNDSLNLKDDMEPVPIFFDFDNVPSFSIELWMKSSATPTTTMVLVGREEDTNNSQLWLGVNTDGSVGFFLRHYSEPSNQLYLEGGSVLDGSWHHIVATYDAISNRGDLYLDKIAVDNGTQNLLNMGGNNPLNIGCMNTDIDKFWYNGQLDELAFYNVALTETAIGSNYDAAVNGQGACVLNYAPVILTAPVTTVNEDSPYNYQIIASDINKNDVVSISAIAKPEWVTITYTPADTFAVLGGTPDNSQVGTHNVTLRVSDGDLNVDQVYQIVVANVNDAPAITSSPAISVNEDALYSYTVMAEDPDAGDVLTYSATEIPEWLSFDAETGVLSGTPTNDEVGIWDVTVNVFDGTANDDQSYQITVNNVNDLPEITTEEVDSAQATIAYLYEIVASDVDEGDVLTYSAETIPDWLTFVAGSTSGILSGTPSTADIGTHAIILKVSDGHGDAIQGFSLVVTAAPVGILEVDNSILNKVFPVPASHTVYFRFADNKKSRIELYDLSGKLLKQMKSDNGEIDMKIADLTNGVYLYKAYQNNKISLGKITKE